MPTINESYIEAEVQSIGRQIFDSAKEELSIHPADWFDARVMEWAMSDEALKVELFRFIDVLPALRSADEVARHLEEYFGQPDGRFPVAAQWSIHLASHNPLAARAAASMVRLNAERMAHRFIAGAAVPEVAQVVRKLRRERMAFTVDLLGEATLSEEEAAAYEERYLHVIDGLSDEADGWLGDPLLDLSAGEAWPRVNVSVKLSALYSQLDASSPDHSSRAVRDRLRPILRKAMHRGAAVTLDMEQYAHKNLTLQVFRDILDEPEFRDWPHGGIALQAYLRETEGDVRQLIEWAKERPAPITVRLVRGAYWDYETVIARQRGWPVPVFTEKGDTDRSYEGCLRLLLEAYPVVRTAAASHNIRSLALAIALSLVLDLPEGATEIQMLYGMADPIKRAITELDWRVRVYTPFGDLLPGMAYLVRRLLENTSNASFLRMRFNENVPVEKLLAAPPLPHSTTHRTVGEPVETPLNPPLARGEIKNTRSVLASPLDKERGWEIKGPFDQRSEGIEPWARGVINEPERDFSQPSAREGMTEAIKRVRTQLGGEYPLLINSDEAWTEESFVSIDPSRPSTIVGRVALASVEDAERAVRAASDALPAWREVSVEERAGVLRKVAAMLRERRDEFAAWEIFEVGKTWREADADVTESIDYLEYYAAEAVRLNRAQPVGQAPGEVNTLLYEPRGVVAVIPPWNFPLAILTGMTSAALVMGNTVVLKPASQSPVIAALFVRMMQQAGLPPGVLNFLPGPGGPIGDYLVDHPSTAMIAFTGSREIGQRIYRRAAEVHPGQAGLKYVIAEMGGKNATIIDADADLDDAVLGVVASAFGYAGQKCSACSRVICIGDVYEPFLKRLVEASRSLLIGPPDVPEHFLGPVIDERAKDRILKTVATGKETASLALEIDASGAGKGYFVGPVVFRDVRPDDPLAQEETFGPVLSVMQAGDLEGALDIANSTPYALTGGIYSRSPAHIEKVKRHFRVGNLYVNRKITGAIVGRQPFGGFKMSGTDVKAGGPDYLQHFANARTITENTLRRGFAPDELASVGPARVGVADVGRKEL